MTDTPKTDFHPALETVFDLAQTEPVPVVSGDKETVVLSTQAFADLLEGTTFKASDIRHVPVDRGQKPGVVIVEQKTYDNLTTIGSFFESPADA